MKSLAIIPARKNSVELPQKNISLFCGKPLISWTIQSALDSAVFDNIMVSTDCEITASISLEYGADVPFLRPDSLSSNDSHIRDTIKDVLTKYSNRLRCDFDVFCLLQPTSPLRNHIHIQQAFSAFLKFPSKQLVSVCKTPNHPAWMRVLNSDGFLENYLTSERNDEPRQNLQTVYILNGAIYISQTDTFLATGSLHQSTCSCFLMDETSSVDIDNILDFNYAEYLMKKKQSSHIES